MGLGACSMLRMPANEKKEKADASKICVQKATFRNMCSMTGARAEVPAPRTHCSVRRARTVVYARMIGSEA